MSLKPSGPWVLNLEIPSSLGHIGLFKTSILHRWIFILLFPVEVTTLPQLAWVVHSTSFLFLHCHGALWWWPSFSSWSSVPSFSGQSQKYIHFLDLFKSTAWVGWYFQFTFLFRVHWFCLSLFFCSCLYYFFHLPSLSFNLFFSIWLLFIIDTFLLFLT